MYKLKKSLALAVAAVMLLPVIPVMAAQTASDIADSILFSMISTQTQQQVTQTLDLSLTEIKEAYPDAVINWQSSNSDVLTISGSKGLITKGTEDAAVTLTAKVKIDDDVASKVFPIKVLKRNSFVTVAEDFEDATVPDDFDFNNTLNDTFTADAADKVLKLSCVTGGSANRELRISTQTPTGSNKWQIKFKFRLDETSNNMEFHLRGDTANKNNQQYKIATFKSGTVNFMDGSAALSNGAIEADFTQWATLTIDFNIDTMSYDVDLAGKASTGEAVNVSKTGLQIKTDATLLSYNNINILRFYTGKNSALNMYIDDINVVTEAGEKLEKDILAAKNGNEIAIRSEYDSDNDFAYVVKNIFENTGVFDNSLMLERIGNMGKTQGNSFKHVSEISGGLLGTPTFNINGYTVGSGKGFDAAVNVESSNHGLSTCDLGRVFTDEASAQWTLISVKDENNLVFLSENTGASNYKWTFASAVSGNLTDGVVTINVDDTTLNQPIYPSTVRKSLSVNMIDENGEKTPLTDDGVLHGETVEIKEEYSIINPVDAMQKLADGRPSEGYGEIPEIDAEKLVDVAVTYTFDSNGVVVIKATHTILKDTDEFDSFSYNAVEAGTGITSLNEIYTHNRIGVSDNGASYEAVILPVLDGFNNLSEFAGGSFKLIEQNELPKNTLPAFIPAEAFPEAATDMTINAVTALRYGTAAETGIFEIDYEGETFLYFDFAKGLSYEYPLASGETRSVVLISNDGDVQWANENGVISVTADSSSDGLIIKIGSPNKTDEEYAREFLEQYGTVLDIDVLDEDYTSAREQILTGFVADLYADAPASHADIHNALMRAQSIPSFCGLAVSQADGRLKKYGKYIGISEETYKNDAEAYGAVEIGTAFREKTFTTTQQILDCYNNRVAALKAAKEETEEDDDDDFGDYGNGNGGGGGGGGTKSPVYIETPEITEDNEAEKVSFKDLPASHWGSEYIQKLTEMNIISGYEDGTVRPEESVTREQLIKMLVIALDLEESDEVKSFTDVPNGHWSEKFISIGAKNGLITGYENGTFAPQASVTREDMAVIINRALIKMGVSLKENSTAAQFNDAESFASYASESIRNVSALGIISGMGNNCFAPKEYLTRAQAAKVIYLVCAGGKGEESK